MENTDKNVGILLGKRIRSLRRARKLTQQELGEKADVNYKFLGEIERGQQNPSFKILIKIAAGLNIDLPELFKFENEITNREELINRIKKIIDSLKQKDLQEALLILSTVFPIR